MRRFSPSFALAALLLSPVLPARAAFHSGQPSVRLVPWERDLVAAQAKAEAQDQPGDQQAKGE